MSQKQSSSEIPRIARPTRPDGLQAIDSTELSRYDILLAIIPLVLVIAWIVAQITSVPTWIALGTGALVSLPAIVDGLALNPPT